LGNKILSLDELIILELKKNGGGVKKDYILNKFKNYSKGYLYDRIQVLRNRYLIVEDFGSYTLTGTGWSVRIDE